MLFALVSCLFLSSCEDYLNIQPKGKRIPKSFVDFEAMLRDEYGCHRNVIINANNLMNNRYVNQSSLGYYPLYKANFQWEESTDRIALNNSDESTYYNGYQAISAFNLVIENILEVPDGTEEERHEVYAQAQVLRAMNYFVLANYYAETYDAQTASTKLSVPLILSADVNAPYTQVTIQEIYDFMITSVKEAIPYLKNESATVLHPNLGSAYALLARIYLQMSDYNKALENANLALQVNDDLYDWTVYYNDYKTQILNATSYTRTPSPFGFNYPENYNYRHGNNDYASGLESIPVERAARFEQGDAHFLSNWKYRSVGADTYFYGTTTGFFNWGGLTTTEMYMIKAECLARAGQIDNAMDVLDLVRVKRILPENYQPSTAANLAEAIQKIRRTKDNALILSIVPFADARRFNKEGTYATTLTKQLNGATISLSPTSHMWTMPFPLGAIENPGNGTITQNVNK